MKSAELFLLDFPRGPDGSMNLSGTIDDEGNGYGALGFVRSVIQHGSNDVIGLVLVNANSEVVQFLSYNGKSSYP